MSLTKNSPQCIYVEKEVFNYPIAKKIISNNSKSCIIEIDHYKDIFCRPKQDYTLQHKSKNIILACKKNNFFYRGSDVCQSFDQNRNNFYYTSIVANCIGGCEYCYLKGMYNCGFLCIFVNIEDYFLELDEMLKQHPIYLCPTYNTDLFPLEHNLHYIEKICEYAKKIENSNNNLLIEIRTKFKCLSIWKYKIPHNIIFAFSLAPDDIIDSYERKTSRLNARLDNINAALEAHVNVRICIDPIIICKNWKKIYDQFINKLCNTIDMSKIKDISIGTFRISQSYFKKLKNTKNDSNLLNYPFVNIDGYYQYSDATRKEIEGYVFNKLSNVVSNDIIYNWRN